VRELVLVISDLYLPREPIDLPDGAALPGFQHVTRFGTRSKLVGGGWRSWLAQWLGVDMRGAATPGTIAAKALGSVQGVAQAAKAQATVWIATPIHLVTSLSSLHLDRRSILRLSPEDANALATEFQRVFHDSGFALRPLESGDFLLLGPPMQVADELEPARVMGESVADAQRRNGTDPTLRRLGAEIEMWLHEHPVNDARARRGEPSVTGLWLWGGGEVPSRADMQQAGGGASAQPDTKQPTAASGTDIAFGRDAYLQGLWASIGRKVTPLPQQLAEVFSYPEAQRAALVIEIGSMLHSAPTWTLFDALAHIDRVFVAPAVEALSASQLQRLVLLANDRELTLRAADRCKLWRRAAPGLSGLQ
jgi:hypothetical protein